MEVGQRSKVPNLSITDLNWHRWLFLIEGLITLTVGVAAFFMMPASAVQTKKWFRPKGWFTTREIGIVVNRILRDDPSKGDMHNRQPVTPRRLWNALKDYDMYPVRTQEHLHCMNSLTDICGALYYWLNCLHSAVCSWYRRQIRAECKLIDLLRTPISP
jgi:hypothetical protein